MIVNGVLQLVIYMVVLTALVKPVGLYMANVYEGKTALNRIFSPVERFIYRLFGTSETTEMNWKTYALASWFSMRLACLSSTSYSGRKHRCRSTREHNFWRHP
jgi:K+-transporting ATPase A subunit